MKLGDYYSIAFRNIRRQPLRSGLTLIALTLSTCVVMLIANISVGGYQAVYSQFGSGDALLTVTVAPSQAQSGINPFGNVTQVGSTKVFTDATTTQLLGIPHVVRAEPRAQIWELASFTVDGSSSQPFTPQAQGLPSGAYLPLSAGQGFGSDNDQNQVIVGYGYAKALGITPASLVGRTIAMTTQKGYRGEGAVIPGPDASKDQVDAFSQGTTIIPAKIIGVTQPGLNQNYVLLPLGWTRQIRTIQYYDSGQLKTTDQLARDGYSSIMLSVDSLADVPDVTNAITTLGYGETSLLATVHQLNQLLAVIAVVLGLVAIIALAAAALGVINTMFMAVSEQEFEIGVLRSCGAKKSVILRIFLTQSLLLGFFGGTLGVLVSLPLSTIVGNYGRSLLQSQGLQSVNLVSFSPLFMLGALFLTLIFSILAGLYPSYKAAKVDPSQALNS